MSKKTKNAYERDKILLAFVGENCPSAEPVTDLEKEYEDWKQSLDEINNMILYCSDIGDTEEVAYWRKLLMHNKMVMREMKEKMMEARIQKKEIVYS